jgi:hypothetical protein
VAVILCSLISTFSSSVELPVRAVISVNVTGSYSRHAIGAVGVAR